MEADTKAELRSLAANCSACGAEALRPTAAYCLVCGKKLGEDYQPLDSLRSSYRLQGRSFLIENTRTETSPDLFTVNRNPVSEVSWACLVYSLVPYIGVLFVPFTILIGGVGFGVFLSKPARGGGRLALVSIGLSFVVLGVQVFLWWLLYIVPELARRPI
ncbi:MAG: hypothetical protein DWQ47_01550 [Acidobacteria bacterium]|nr:MAG: hypothetical protein DWQ32_12010 [Acidobacteriota bacterium]REK04181.1 MAG: hypothetical protein DWQ38_01535 [Acidobacteriota bacterium]REK15343.1 MAG: hypothetical protein DWQ43_17700 [Acidobacteriota bacterium]REK46433.1 MAG: hypothetical protein DWQ47_01550 [Acidobacteriota bacterium]